VFLADAQRAWELTPELQELSRKDQIELIGLEPWNDSALRQWMEDCQFGPRDRAGRLEITHSTGNWSMLLDRFQKLAGHAGTEWRGATASIEREWFEGSSIASSLEKFGIRNDERRAVLQTLATLDLAASASDIAVVDDCSHDTAQKVINWALLVHLIKPAADGCVEIEPTVGRLLRILGNKDV
jgi:hypothetical protein